MVYTITTLMEFIHGSPCKHIWIFISGILENYYPSHWPCGTSGVMSVPSFVGTDYYCESVNPDNN